MKIIVPHTEKLSEILIAVCQSLGFTPELRYMDRVNSYHELLSELWHQKETFIIIEQDVLPVPDIIQEMWNCGHRWCGAQFLIAGNYMQQPLGCSKFSAAMIEACPTMIDDLPIKRWYSLDGQIYTAGHEAQVKLHKHGKVIHLNHMHFPE